MLDYTYSIGFIGSYLDVWGLCPLTLEGNEEHALFPATSRVANGQRENGGTTDFALKEHGENRQEVLRDEILEEMARI